MAMSMKEVREEVKVVRNKIKNILVEFEDVSEIKVEEMTIIRYLSVNGPLDIADVDLKVSLY